METTWTFPYKHSLLDIPTSIRILIPAIIVKKNIQYLHF